MKQNYSVSIIEIVMFGNVFVLGLILVLLGAYTVINAFRMSLVISTTSRTDYVINVLIFEKSTAERAADMMTAMIGSRMDNTNTRMRTEGKWRRMRSSTKISSTL